MKKFFAMVLCIVLISGFSSCGDQVNPSGEIGFDVSKYDAHGEVSCGRLWVEKHTEGKWNESSKSKFAYFDTKGNQITKWISSEDYTKGDYNNNYVFLFSESYLSGTETRRNCIIYDVNGKSVYGGSVLCDSKNQAWVTNPNKKGQIMILDSITEDGYSVFCIDKKYSNTFNCNKLPLFSENVDFLFEKQNDYFVLTMSDLLGGQSEDYLAYIYDLSLNLKIDLQESIGYVPFKVKISDDNTIKAEFKGENGKNYSSFLSMDGEIIKSPDDNNTSKNKPSSVTDNDLNNLLTAHVWVGVIGDSVMYREYKPNGSLKTSFTYVTDINEFDETKQAGEKPDVVDKWKLKDKQLTRISSESLNSRMKYKHIDDNAISELLKDCSNQYNNHIVTQFVDEPTYESLGIEEFEEGVFYVSEKFLVVEEGTLRILVEPKSLKDYWN